MTDKQITRRGFMRNSAVAVAGVTMGLSAVTAVESKDQAAIRKTRSYNPEMEYRRLGKTGLWISAVCPRSTLPRRSTGSSITRK